MEESNPKVQRINENGSIDLGNGAVLTLSGITKNRVKLIVTSVEPVDIKKLDSRKRS